jgi:hypothetical protein
MIDIILTVIRQIMLVAGGAVSGSGVVSASEWETITGAVLVIAAAIWRYYDQHKKAVALKDAKGV